MAYCARCAHTTFCLQSTSFRFGHRADASKYHRAFPGSNPSRSPFRHRLRTRIMAPWLICHLHRCRAMAVQNHHGQMAASVPSSEPDALASWPGGFYPFGFLPFVFAFFMADSANPPLGRSNFLAPESTLHKKKNQLKWYKRSRWSLVQPSFQRPLHLLQIRFLRTQIPSRGPARTPIHLEFRRRICKRHLAHWSRWDRRRLDITPPVLDIALWRGARQASEPVRARIGKGADGCGGAVQALALRVQGWSVFV